ncbi:retroviral-like aspartic protease, partial [Klebsiella pneumoniae]|nr:retroviral-like aspartic protease [Klebsiella pneumoniae]
MKKIFKFLVRKGILQFPDNKKPEEESQISHPTYCPFHRHTGHVLEDCFVFKDKVESLLRSGAIQLQDCDLVEPKGKTVQVVSESHPCSDYIASPCSAEEWQIALSRKTRMMIRQAVRPTPAVQQRCVQVRQAVPTPPVPTAAVQPPSASFPSFIHVKKMYEKEKYVVTSEGKVGSLPALVLKDFLSPTSEILMKEDSEYSVCLSTSASTCFTISHVSDDEKDENMLYELGYYLEEEEPTFTLPEDAYLLDSGNESEDASQVPLKEPLQATEPEPVGFPVESDSIQEIQLRSGRIFPPRMAKTNKDKEKNIVTQQDDLTPSPQVQPKEKAKGPLLDVDYNVLAHLRKIPSLLSVYDALMMSSDLRETLVKALLEPETYQAYFATESLKDVHYLKEMPGITFSDQDLLLGTTEHNRPLYVTAEVNGCQLNRVLIDPGASVNILNVEALKSLSLGHLKLTSDKIMLKGFNDKGQRALGSITLPLQFGELRTEAKFHVIDADTSYKALLGRPWIHEHEMIPSTLHQCMKYLRDGVEHSIPGDTQPFIVHEVTRYDDAEYYIPRQSTRPSVPQPSVQLDVTAQGLVQSP